MSKIGDIWYRYEDIRYAAPLDEYDQAVGRGRLVIELRKFEVNKITPKGVWLAYKFGALTCGDRRFVLLDAHKRFACPTIKEAKESFLARKRKQSRIYKSRMLDAEEAIHMIEAPKEKWK